jgi:ABC-type lipoprotein release transport system permease subunit
MIYFLRLGWRNVFRQRLRTGLALGAIGLAVALLMIGNTFARGMEKFVFSEVIGEAGEIVVARQDYFDRSRFNPMKYPIRGAAELRSRLLQVPGVRAALPRIDFGILVQLGEQNEPVACSAVDVLEFARFSKLPSKIVAGRWLRPDEKAVLLGRLVADRLGVKPGDTITVLGRTAYDSFTGDDFVVAGIFDLGVKLLNRTAIVPLGPAQEFLDMQDAVSKLLLFGPSYLDADAIAGTIRSRGLLPAGVAVRSWTQDPFFGSLYTLDRAVRIAITVILCFVAGLGILNMMMVSVLERRREIGVFMALGMSRAGLLTTFLYEALLYGVIGSAVGSAIGSPLALLLDRVGIDFQADKIQGVPFPLPNRLHGDFGPDSLVIGLAIGVLLSLLGMLWPMLKTFSMKPHDAMAK